MVNRGPVLVPYRAAGYEVSLLSACSLCLLPMHEIIKSNRHYNIFKVLCYQYKKKILWDTKTNNLETYHMQYKTYDYCICDIFSCLLILDAKV